MTQTGRILLGAGFAATAAALAFGYTPPAHSLTVDVVAAIRTNVLEAMGFSYTPCKRGFGYVTDVKYTAFNTAQPTNRTPGVVSSVIAMAAEHAKATPDGIEIHSDAQLTNAIGIIHR